MNQLLAKLKILSFLKMFPKIRIQKNNYFLHVFLLFLTFFTTTIAGIQWLNIEAFYDLENFHLGLPYSFSLLFILLCHEFGHYFASRYHKVDATLPFLIPLPTLPGFLNFGTLGAIIKTRSSIPTYKALFDIGAYGPLSGFIACLLVLIWGLTHLPSINYLHNIHPEYIITGVPEGGLTFGNNLLYIALSKIFINPTTDFLPPMNEIYHYPFLCVGWFGLLVTSMNLIPSGQLDGGHVFYAMFGKKIHKIISMITTFILILMGLSGLLFLIFPSIQIGWPGWLVWGLILFFVIKTDHPPIDQYDESLDLNRKILGWLIIIIFIISFMPVPISIFGLE